MTQSAWGTEFWRNLRPAATNYRLAARYCCVALNIYIREAFQSCVIVSVSRELSKTSRRPRDRTNSRTRKGVTPEHTAVLSANSWSLLLQNCALYRAENPSRTLRRAHTASDRQGRLKRTRRRAAADRPVGVEQTDEGRGPVDDGYDQALAQWRINEAVERAEGRAKIFLRQLWCACLDAANTLSA